MTSILFWRFLATLIPVFLLFVALGIALSVRVDLSEGQAELTLRVGNFAARTASAIERYGSATIDRQLAQDLLAPLAAERAVTCVELRAEGSGTLISALPPARGCGSSSDGELLVLSLGEQDQASLIIRFSDAVLADMVRSRHELVLVAVGIAFVIALISAGIGFRWIVTARLRTLLNAFDRNTQTGERITIASVGGDELGDVITAFNRLSCHEQVRERELQQARQELHAANQQLEQRVERRTRALTGSQASLLQLIELHPSAICVQRDGVILYANPAAIRQDGAQAAAQLVGRDTEHLFAENCRSEVACRLSHASLNSVPERFDDVTRIRLDGSCFQSEGVCTPVQWQGDGALLMEIRDISERKQTELAMTLARERAEQAAADAESANQAKSTFLATMSHEIRTPMNGVLGMLELLDNDHLDSVQNHRVTIARRSAQALLEVIDDILDFSKVEAGRMELETVPLNLRTVVHDVIDLLTERAAAKSLQLVCSIDDQVPGRVFGDPGRLRQVFLNLVGNAIKFTNEGRIEITVDLIQTDFRGQFTRLRCAVVDNGCGISPTVQSELFTAFAQAESSTNRRFGGSGLGLAICKQLVLLMGGEIGVVSEVGAGSTFWFEAQFDIASQRFEAVTRPGVSRQKAKVPEALIIDGAPRVLLVEDDIVNQMVASEMLAGFGCEISVAGDGQEAVTLSEGEQFDLILMDCQMPGMGGLDATRRIRAIELERGAAPIRIVALTANAMQDDRDACIAAGMDDYLAKPFPRAALEEILHRWLAASEPVQVPLNQAL